MRFREIISQQNPTGYQPLVMILLVIIPAISIGLLTSISPIGSIGFVAITAYILLFTRSPKIGLFLFGIFFMFQNIIRFFVGEYYGSWISWLLHFLIGIFFVISFVKRLSKGEEIRIHSIGYIVFALTCIGFLSSYVSHITNMSVALGQYLLTMKGILLFYIFFNIDYDRSDIDTIFNIAIITGAFISVTTFINIVIPEQFINFFGGDKQYRMGFLNPVSIFGHPSSLGNVMTLISCFPLALYIITSKKKYLIWSILFLIAMFASMRVMSIFAILFALIVATIILRTGERKRIVTPLLFLVLPSVFVLSNMITQILSVYFTKFDPYSIARDSLYITSKKIALDYFPLGSGFGTFGGWMSRVHYSPLYYKYGLSSVWGLSEKNPQFINDTFWPHILAEVGIIGFILYALIFAIFLRSAKRGVKLFQTSTERCFSLTCLMVIVASLVLSTKSTVYEMSLIAYIVFGSLGILFSCMLRETRKT